MSVDPSRAPAVPGLLPHSDQPPLTRTAAASAVTGLGEATWRRTCFHASPIGIPGSKHRRHADGMRDDLIRPAVALVDDRFKVVRGDELSSSSITNDVFAHVENSGLMVADLSFHNANVLYEVGRRHKTEKPCVLIMPRGPDPLKPAGRADRSDRSVGAVALQGGARRADRGAGRPDPLVDLRRRVAGSSRPRRRCLRRLRSGCRRR